MPASAMKGYSSHSHPSHQHNVVKAHLNTDKDIIVIKVGTSSLVRPEQQTLNLTNLARICETIKGLHAAGHHVIIVSSGAVGVGCQRLGLTQRPTQIAKKQALAAVGQVHLVSYYQDLFSALGVHCAQVLLTLDNLANRDQYLNARNTFAELLAFGAVPIVNENDTVAVHALRFGDNDTLSAQVAALVQADWLFLMTDVDCLYTANPKEDPNATPIHEVPDISKLQADTSTRDTEWGTGGMATKLTAGRIATASGCTMVICSSECPEAIPKVMAGERVGTRFHPAEHALRGRKRWILSVPVRGTITLDDGAVRAVQTRKKSLFAAGITNVEGAFHAQDAVSLCDLSGVEFARGLVNFSSEEVRRVQGASTKDFLSRLGYNAQSEVVHRENLSLLSAPHLSGGSDEEDGPPIGIGLNSNVSPGSHLAGAPTTAAHIAAVLASRLGVSNGAVSNGAVKNGAVSNGAVTHSTVTATAVTNGA